LSEVLFYHLEKARLEEVLTDLLEKTIAKGWKASVRCNTAQTAGHLDEYLWTFRDDAFLPHGIALGEKEDARQPILISDSLEPLNNPDVLFLVEGAECDAKDVAKYKRCVRIFDGNHDEAIAQARLFWKAVKAEKYDVTYWKQSVVGKWERQA